MPKSQIFNHACFITGWYLLCQPGYLFHKWYSSTPGWVWLTQMISQAYDDANFHRYWTTVGSLPMVYAVLRIPWLKRFFDSRPLQFLGRVRFSLCLVHLPSTHIFADRVKPFFGGWTNPVLVGSIWDHTFQLSDAGPPSLSLRFLVAMSLILPSTILVAWMVTIAVDEPSVRMSKCVSRRLGLEKSKKEGNCERRDGMSPL